jgi:bleomycin hydrolase
MKRVISGLITLMMLGGFFAPVIAQKENGYQFTMVKKLPCTSVKNQNKSGTCWSYSGLSFLESELLRMGKGEYNLSEMFVVDRVYDKKAVKYVRMHGTINFGAGGEFNDVVNVVAHDGIVPEAIYNPGTMGDSLPVHGEMDAVLKAYVGQIIKNPNKKLTPVWHEGFDGILDAYLGPVPKTFQYKGQEYTPQSFAKSLGLNPDDYVLITSFTHHTFYKPFILEIPDNWSWGEVYNVPLNDLVDIVNNSVNKGYTVAWAADVSEKGFSFKNGIAIIPDADVKDMNNAEREKWEKLTKKEKDEELYSFDKPGKEKVITQEMRQKAFDDYATTDDHGMHIVGMAKDQNGTPYYYVKNSWGTNNPYNGFLYVSVPYFEYKTTSIMVNKKAVPESIAKKLNW